MNDAPAHGAPGEPPLRNASRAGSAIEAARCAELEAALQRAVAERDAWAQELFESNRFAGELVVARQSLEDELATVRKRERAEARAEAAPVIVAARRERDCAWQDRDRALRERDRAREAHREAAATLRRVTTSTFWRLTTPFRHALIVLLGRPR